MNDFFQDFNSIRQTVDRTVESLGVPYSDPFNEEGVIVSVDDPKKLGRVKVITSDGLTSQWINMAGSSGGTISSKYVGARVIVGKADGRSESMYVMGVLSESETIGTPIQLPILDEGVGVWSGSNDEGMKCNKGNEGRLYVINNEINQDVIICLRRSNKQTGSGEYWAWKSLTNGLLVEKGINPANEGLFALQQPSGAGIPKCSEALLGEKHDFTEERGFRTTTLVCRRDENKEFGWVPDSAAPVYFRTTLPACSESLHGMEAVIDDGNNSEFIVCQRYQGAMRWVKQGSRLPHKFYGKEKPLSRIDFTSKFNPIPELEDAPLTDDWSAEPKVVEATVDELVRNIPLTGTDPILKKLLQTAGLVPATAFNGAGTLSRVASAALNAKTGVPAQQIVQELRRLIGDGVDPASSQLLNGLGQAANVLVNGVRSGEVEGALGTIGQTAISSAISTFSPQAASVFSSMVSGGVWGAIDGAVGIGLNKLPPEVIKYVGPILTIAEGVAGGYPTALKSILSGVNNGNINSAISNIINGAVGTNIVTPELLSGLTGGALGVVGQVFGQLGNLPGLERLPEPLQSVPKLASTALGLIGLADVGQRLFGAGGIGLGGLQGLLVPGSSAAGLIAGGISALSGLFGSNGSVCPCDEKCRKIEHGDDSDGNRLLKPCGSLTANNANSYSPTGTPIPNNFGPIAKELGLIATGLGGNLIPKNIRDLGSMIEGVGRVKDLAERGFGARFADKTEQDLENAYGLEAIEKTLKFADNNITRIESIDKKLIDSMYNLVRDVVFGNKTGATIDTLIRDVRENAEAIRDIYGFVKRLDRIKKGGKAGVKVTPSISKSLANIPSLEKLISKNRKSALTILRSGITAADKEWKTLGSGGENTKFVLGSYAPPIPDPFPNERTLFNSNRVLSESLLSKILSEDLQSPTILDAVLTSNDIEELKRVRSITPSPTSPTSPDNIYSDIINRQGETNCE